MNVSKRKPKCVLYQKYHNTVTKLRKNDLWSYPRTSIKDSTASSSTANFNQPISPPLQIYGKFFIFIFICQCYHLLVDY